jgi:hypothetical protein
MASRYMQITLEEAVAGMVLSDDILDSHGNVLLRGGCSLSNSTIASLKQHHIETLSIASNEEISAEAEEAERAIQITRLSKLFRKPGNDAEDATNLLAQLVRDFRLGKAQ